MAIKDLRESKKIEEKIASIQKEAYAQAFESILMENVVLKEEEFKTIIENEIKKAKLELLDKLGLDESEIETAFVIKESQIESVENKLLEKYSETQIEILKEKFNMAEAEVSKLLESKEKAYVIKESQLEEVENKMVEEFNSKLEEKFGAKFSIIKEAVENGEEYFVIKESQIKEVENKMVEAFDTKLEESLGEEKFAELTEAIKNKEEFFIIKESEMPLVEEKMIERIKENLNGTDSKIEEKDGSAEAKRTSLAEKLMGGKTSISKKVEEKVEEVKVEEATNESDTQKSLAEKLLEDEGQGSIVENKTGTLAGKLI